MSRDETLEERFETVLYHFGVNNSGSIAKQLHGEYIDWLGNEPTTQTLRTLNESENDE